MSNPFAAISGGSGGLSTSLKDEVKQSIGGARGNYLGPINTGQTFAPASSSNALIYAGAALLAVYLLRGKL